jgi:hypothetical protein
MVRMDHSDAVRLEAAEKYVLGELSPTQREEYEEHYFDCGLCALDVRAVAAFADTAREVLRRDAERDFRESKAATRGGWFRWLRPAFAVPAMAVLLLVVGYQNFVTIPAARQEAADGAAQVFASPFSLQMANVRGGEEVKIQMHSNESLPLKFDFTPGKIFDQYICQIQDETGHSLFQVKVPGTLANKEVNMVVPAGSVKTGKYALVFAGASTASKPPSREEVLRLSFSVEILP